VNFLGFIKSQQVVEADPEKVRAILEWLESQSVFKVRSFHSLATFYHQVFQAFSTIMALITVSERKSF